MLGAELELEALRKAFGIEGARRRIRALKIYTKLRMNW